MKASLGAGLVVCAVIAMGIVAWLDRTGNPGTTPAAPEAPHQTSSPGVGAATSTASLPVSAATDLGTRPAHRTSIEWYRMLEDPGQVVAGFRDAVRAAEDGDFNALRQVHDYVARCRYVFGYVREGGSRERHVQGQQWLPPGGMVQVERTYDRCAAVASSPEFAAWPLTDGRLTVDYWQQTGQRLKDPVFIGWEAGEELSVLATTEGATRASLKKSITENIRQVMRSDDAAGWMNLGSMALSDRFSSDPSYGLALILASCERGYDCTNANPNNLLLNCEFNANCAAATTLAEQFNQHYPPEVNARARAHLLELQSFIQEGDWARIEGFIPLDGKAFR